MQKSPDTGREKGEETHQHRHSTDLDELRDTVNEAADQLEAEGEPLTVGRLAGTTLRLGLNTDTHPFSTVADTCRFVIAKRDHTEVKTEVAR